jgi:mono/diheme cytochrome c family protein
LVLVAAAPSPFGGWAVITVHDLPEYLRVGTPARLEFTIRQHGMTPMNDRSPVVKMKGVGDGWLSRGQRFNAARVADAGRYAALITPDDTGSVEITIDADWYAAQVTLLPMRVVARGQDVAALAAPERGRQLFVATGCVTCHMKSDDARLGERDVIPAGPALTGRQFPVEWLAQKLADPARLRVGTGQGTVMPTLGLAEHEIAALVSYVNTRQAGVQASVR